MTKIAKDYTQVKMQSVYFLVSSFMRSKQTWPGYWRVWSSIYHFVCGLPPQLLRRSTSQSLRLEKNTLFELNFKIGETFILSLLWRHRFLLLSWREKLKGKKRKEEKRDTYLLGVLGVQNTVVEQFGIWLQWVHFKSNYF